MSDQVEITVESTTLIGDLRLPDAPSGIVLFAHGSGSSRLSPRNRQVAERLRRAGLGTLLFDLLTADEERVDIVTREFRFDVRLLADRLVAATHWILARRPTFERVGYFGASTGAAAALIAAAEVPGAVGAIVSRGGRPDLAAGALRSVRAATQLIVGGRDEAVLALNRMALRELDCEKELVVIPLATHLFEEPGALDAVSDHAAAWFARHLSSV